MSQGISSTLDVTKLLTKAVYDPNDDGKIADAQLLSQPQDLSGLMTKAVYDPNLDGSISYAQLDNISRRLFVQVQESNVAIETIGGYARVLLDAIDDVAIGNIVIPQYIEAITNVSLVFSQIFVADKLVKSNAAWAKTGQSRTTHTDERASVTINAGTNNFMKVQNSTLVIDPVENGDVLGLKLTSEDTETLYFFGWAILYTGKS